MTEQVIIFVIVGAAAALLVHTAWRSWTRRDGCACGVDPAQCPLGGSVECTPEKASSCPMAERMLVKDAPGEDQGPRAGNPADDELAARQWFG